MLRGVRASASVFGQRDTAQSLLEVPRVLFVLLDFFLFFVFFGKVTLKEKKFPSKVKTKYNLGSRMKNGRNTGELFCGQNAAIISFFFL